MKIGIDLTAELSKQGYAWTKADVPKPDSTAPRYWLRYDGGEWQPLEPDTARNVKAITRDLAYRRAIQGLESADADVLELAVKPNDASVFFTDSAPPRKATLRREVIVVRDVVLPGLPLSSTSARVPFRTVARTLWCWLRLGERPRDIFEVAENDGRGAVIWKLPPSEVEIPCPEELVDVAPDRVGFWEALAAGLFERELAGKLAVDIDTGKVAKAALKAYQKDFREADLPELVTRWTPESRDWYVRMHELMCSRGLDRQSRAQEYALKTIAEQYAADIVAGRIAI